MNGAGKVHGMYDCCEGLILGQAQENIDHSMGAMNRAMVAEATAAAIGMAVVDWTHNGVDPRRPPGFESATFIGDDNDPLFPQMTAVLHPAT